MNKQIVNYKNDEEMQSIIKAKQRNIKIIQIPMYLSLVGILLPFVGVIFDIYGPIIDTVFRVVPVVCIFIGFLLAILCNKKNERPQGVYRTEYCARGSRGENSGY